MSYWDNVTQARISRRLALRASAAGASLAALILAGCGGGSSSSKGGDAAGSKGLVVEPVNTTAKATKGGTMQYSLPADVTSFDPIGGNTGVSFTQGLHTYSRLMKFKPNEGHSVADGSLNPDAAASWESAPDGTQFTFKIGPNQKFDPRPPTNGRVMTSADVKYWWDRFSAVNQQRTDLSHAVNPAAPVDSLTTPDANTVVIKLAYPSAPFLTNLSYYRYGGIMPVETESFNYKGEMRGTGPWRLDSYVPSSVVHFKKNPDYYDASKVMLDGIDYFIIPEYATGLSQFRSGNLWYYAVQQEDVIRTKKDVPELLMQSSGVFTHSLSPWMSGSVLPGSPFLDERVRRALSMLIDRDLWIDIFYNVSAFKKEGLDLPTRWTTHLPPGWDQWWLDPKGKDLGEGAKNFQYSPDEAKKLLQATGLKLPLEMNLHWTINGYADPYRQQTEAYQAMFEGHGDFKFNRVGHDYATDWTPNFHSPGAGKAGQWDGLAIGTMSTQPDIDGTLFEIYRSGSVKQHHGFPDPLLDSKIDSQRKELDPSKRTELIKDLERYLATKMYSIHGVGQALTFTLGQPFYGNYGYFKTYEGGAAGAEELPLMWYDASKKKA